MSADAVAADARESASRLRPVGGLLRTWNDRAVHQHGRLCDHDGGGPVGGSPASASVAHVVGPALGGLLAGAVSGVLVDSFTLPGVGGLSARPEPEPRLAAGSHLGMLRQIAEGVPLIMRGRLPQPWWWWRRCRASRHCVPKAPRRQPWAS
jgi:hypothetical protein